MQLRVEWVLVIFLIATGVCLRFAWLDRKVYWYDEAFTSLEISGYSPQDASTDILSGRVVTASELEKYQFPSAASPKSVRDTVQNLIVQEPQLTPLYFIVLRGWSELFPNSVAAIRVLSALFSVATLALAFWLCRELFSTRVALTAVALMSISPLLLLYAQEARPYSMWSAAVLMTSSVLLLAMRRKTVPSWALYALCAAVSLYTFLFSALVIAGHACFVAVDQRFRITSTVRSFCISVALAVASFLLWPYRGQHSGAGNEHYSLSQYGTKWIRSIAILFADFNFRDTTPKPLLLPYALLLLALLALCAYSIYFMWRNATRKQAAFVLTLIGSLCLSLLLLDVVRGSSVSVVTRYTLPSLIGIQLAVAYMLVAKTAESSPNRTRWTWRCVAAMLAVIGLFSCWTLARADVWWSKEPQNYIQSASRVINAAPEPVVVLSDTWFIPVLSLEHKLRPDVRYLLTVEPRVPQIQESAATIFVFQPSAHLRMELEKYYPLVLLDPAANLWRLSTGARPSVH
ncbi:MAG: glycosyltransferase family 39 protein [Steroidobacteraceae bacterium]|jgi:uncharacterized membrane protein